AAEVRRGGRTARSWTFETSNVQLETENGKLRLRFSLSSKGGGITDVKVTIGSADFSALAGALATADRSIAVQAMSATLTAELSKQPEFDLALTRTARQSVVEAAARAFRDAPDGRDHAERLTWDMVRQLVEQLNEADSAESEGDDGG